MRKLSAHGAMDAEVYPLNKEYPKHLFTVNASTSQCHISFLLGNIPRLQYVLFRIASLLIYLDEFGARCATPEQAAHHLDVRRNTVLVPVCIISGRGQPRVDCGNGGVFHELLKEPNLSTVINFEEVPRSHNLG